VSDAKVVFVLDGPVARIEIARPEVKNALDGETARELCSAVLAVSTREDVRIVVLAGRGSVFCAGADLEWMKAMAGATREENRADAAELADLFAAIDRSPKAVVARVQGAALGGGAGLVAAADIAVAAEDARFGFTEARLGLVPGVISPYAVRRIGVSAARELFLTGERFDAGRARALGLVHHVVPLAGLDAAVDGRVKELLQSAPGAIAAAKALIRGVGGRAVEDVRELTIDAITDRRASEEGREGLAAFLEKRKPRWTG
jgi:methylglutaconyl-CoA hydratase